MKEKILIVDDEKANICLLEEILNMYNTIVAEDAKEMWSILEEETPDLILMDIMLPGEDGFDLVSKIYRKEKFKDIPIIFVTAKVGSEDLERGFDLGAYDYIKKPFNDIELLARINATLEKKRSERQLKKQSLIVDNYIDLFCDLIDVNKNIHSISSLDVLLKKITDIFVMNTNIDVSSIYLYNMHKNELILKATKGFNRSFENSLRLQLGEGIVGYCMKEMKTVVEEDVNKSQYFKPIKDLGEELYNCFLAIPIIHHNVRVGVITFQKKKGDAFDEREVEILETATLQLANIIENTKFVFKLTGKKQTINPHKDMFKKGLIKGKVVVEGFVYGNAVLLDRDRTCASFEQKKFETYILQDFNKAVIETEKSLRVIQDQVKKEISEEVSGIFAAHLLMLKDKTFIDSIRELIKEGVNPPKAILKVSREYIDIFSKSTSPYLQEKYNDIEDLTITLITNLTQKKTTTRELENSIVVTKDLFPSDIPKLFSKKISGIILIKGTATSHIAILARSLDIPFIVIDFPDLTLEPKSKLLLDGKIGSVYFNPSVDIVNSFERRKKRREGASINKNIMKKPTVTKCGAKIKLMTNVNFLRDIKLANECNAEGVGLYRSEIPFLIRSNFLTEEEQFVIYKELIDGMKGKEINFRTLDIGGDKFLPSSYLEEEKNPFLGMRSIRFCLKNKNIFMMQIRAILRASFNADIKIMFPMISSKEEFLEARRIVFRCMRDLEKKGIKYNKNPRIGMMIELPSAVEIIDDLALQADFFSIGTNDLVQYVLGVDRTNEKVSRYYLTHHPAILKILKRIADASNSNDIDLSLCGNMAHEKKYLKFLLGIGIKSFSVDPIYMPRVKNWIKNIDLEKARQEVDRMLSLTTQDRIKAMLTK